MALRKKSSCLVAQSHQSPLPLPWLEATLESVADWAALRGYDYRLLDDELFEFLPGDLNRLLEHQRVVASDLARLLWLRQELKQGYECVVWADADLLVFNAPALHLPRRSYAFGREVWVQWETRQAQQKHRLKSWKKIHNAFLMFRQGNPFLDFYVHAAEELIRQHEGNMVPQLVGPKFLSAIHNLLKCPVIENVASFSPLVIQDLLAGGGAALDLMLRHSSQPPVAANLCASSVVRGELSSSDMARVIAQLLSVESTAQGRITPGIKLDTDFRCQKSR